MLLDVPCHLEDLGVVFLELWGKFITIFRYLRNVNIDKYIL